MSIPLRIGENVGVIMPGGQIAYYRVSNRDRIFHRETFAAIAGGANADYASVGNLIPPRNQLYHVERISLDRGNVRVLIRQPGSTQRWNPQRSATTAFISDEYEDVDVDMFVMQDYEPNVRLENQTPVSTTPRVRFIGWKYSLQELQGKPPLFTLVSTGGLGL